MSLVLVANKSDLLEYEEKEKLCEIYDSFDLQYFFTSAKTGENIDEAFDYLTEEILAK